MARLPRLIVAGLPHLVSQRAQHGQAMVRDDDDRRSLLGLLREASRQHGVALHGYGIGNHRFDLVATPKEAEGLSLLMQAVARRHASAFNRRHRRAGGLWEGRFRAAVLEPEPWLLTSMVYAEQAAGPFVLPGNGGTLNGPHASWSSRSAHLGQLTDPLLTDPAAYWSLGNTPFDREAAYRARAEQGISSMQEQQIEQALKGGWALGSAAFAQQLQLVQERPASPRSRGRPRKPAVSP